MASSSISWSRNGSAAKTLAEKFYERDTLEVARDLLGKVLIIRPKKGVELAARIVETEAYSQDDPASHSCKGETPRAAVMFGRPGRAYVYFIYGMYEMLNFVTEREGRAGAVLIRAVEPLEGEEWMQERRKTSRNRADLTNGPGKLCRALGIRMSHNRASLQGPALEVCDDGFRAEEISVSPRVGITAAKEKPWRFFLTGNPFVSRAPQNKVAVTWGAR